MLCSIKKPAGRYSVCPYRIHAVCCDCGEVSIYDFLTWIFDAVLIRSKCAIRDPANQIFFLTDINKFALYLWSLGIGKIRF